VQLVRDGTSKRQNKPLCFKPVYVTCLLLNSAESVSGATVEVR